MASFDLLKYGSNREFKNIFDFYENELILGEFIILNNKEWIYKKNHKSIDNQLHRDVKGTINYIINGIKYFRESFESQNDRFIFIKTHIKNLIKDKYKLIILKYMMCQSTTFGAGKIIKDKLNIDDISINMMEGEILLIDIQIINDNIIIEYNTKYSIKYSNYKNGEIPITIIETKTYINYNENKIIVSFISNQISNGISSKLYNILNSLNTINRLGSFLDYTFYKVIRLDFQSFLNDMKKEPNINEHLFEKVKINSLVLKNGIYKNIIYKINGTELTDLKIMLNNNLIHKFCISNIKPTNITNLENIKYNNYKNKPYDDEHQKILFLLNTEKNNLIVLNTLKNILFENNTVNIFSLEIDLSNIIEKNFFIYDNVKFITEYNVKIIVNFEGIEYVLSVIYVYNTVCFDNKNNLDNSNNLYKINFHIKSINIENFLKLKFIFKQLRLEYQNNVLDNILQLYDNNFIKLKINSIINKIEINKTIINNTLNKITKTLPDLKKNHFSQEKSDVLLISFNENRQLYNDKDCLPIIIKILIEKPKIIIVCTQETIEHVTNARLLQSFFGKFFFKDSSYKVIIDRIIKSLGYTEKTHMRSKSEIMKDRVFHNISNKTKIYFIDTLEDNEPVIEVIKNERYIISKINFTYLEIDYSIAIVNCNLSIENNYTKLKEILEYANSLQLNELYDIFFCGDINFKFISQITNVRSYEIFKKNYLNEKRNQFYKIFSGISVTNESRIFYLKLLDSINYLGRHLTSPYLRSKSEKEI